MSADYAKIKNYVSSLFFGTWILAFIVGFVACIVTSDRGAVGFYTCSALLWIPYFIVRYFTMREFKALLEKLEYYR